MDSKGKFTNLLINGGQGDLPKGKGRLRTLSSTVKPGKFDVSEDIAIGASAWVIYITCPIWVLCIYLTTWANWLLILRQGDFQGPTVG